MQPPLSRAGRAIITRLTHVVSIVVMCLALASSWAFAANPSVGIYSDNNGYSCSLSADGSGFVIAYVVVRPGSAGIHGVRFSAPLPACFKGTFLAETAPGFITVSGSSPAGISLSSQNCETEPFYALQILYQSTGTTAPCCDFPVLADPAVGTLEATDCAYNTIPLTANVARVNADATCPCGVTVQPPNPPSNPSPADGSGSQPPGGQQLSCTVSDPGGLPMTYDLYFGSALNPPLVVANGSTTGTVTFNPGALSFVTTYYWKVVVRNPTLAEASGPVWSFTTSANTPATVGNVSPMDGAIKVFETAKVFWLGVDPDGLPLNFDVYFGTNPSPLLVASNVAAQSFQPGTLAFSTKYYWRIVSHEVGGGTVSSLTWSFTTKAPNEPPGPVIYIDPLDGATGRSFNTDLDWQCTDFEGQALRYDVYLGTSNNPPKIVTNQSASGYSTSGLQEFTKYYWRIVARDPGGLESAGSTFSFTTKVNLPPSAPSNPSPADNSTNHGTNITLQWTRSDDPEYQLVTYDVYFGASNPPALVATNEAFSDYHPAGVQYSTTYFWRIVARDASGAETSGPTWKFTTRANPPPNVPVAITPVTGQSSNYPITGEVRWSCSDPDQQALVFDVYFGTALDPPLVSSGEPYTSFSPGVMQANTTYRWRIVARDTDGLERSGPVWSLTTTAGANHPPAIPSNPSPPNGYLFTPRNPVLKWNAQDPDGNPVVYFVTVWNFDNSTYYYSQQQTTVPQLATNNLAKNVIYSWKVEVTDGEFQVNGPIWTFHVDFGFVPVLFSHFDAKQESGGVRINWELSSDEPMDGLTLYRRDGAASPRAIMTGDVTGERGSYLDRDAAPGTTYQYELVIHATGGDDFRSPMATVTIPTRELALHQNVPNPFNPQTSIRYDLPSSGRVQLFVLDVSGKLVRTLVNEEQAAGSREVLWNGRDDRGNSVSSGVYFYVLDAGKQRLTRKLVLLK